MTKPYQFIRTPTECAVVPDHAHAYVLPLKMAPVKREPVLDRGTWLILLFAVWSAPDREQIATLMEIDQQLTKDLQFGVRPFDDRLEFRSWCPTLSDEWGSPIWLLLRDGEVAGKLVGTREKPELEHWITTVLR
jgi:hypothetical protein